MNKYVIYTCIIGKYDTLKEIKYRTPGFDYVCFTDQNYKSNDWEIRPIPEFIQHLSPSRQNRYLKINAHKIFPEYEFSVYIDGSMTTIGNLNELKDTVLNIKDKCMYLIPHASRDCIYEEFLQCAKRSKEDVQIMGDQIRQYINDGFPTMYGLTHNCILFRYHNDKHCIEIMDKVWEIMTKYSHRDQLAMMYAIWKTNNRQYVEIINTDLIMPFIDYSIGWFHDLYCERALRDEINKAKYLVKASLSKDFEEHKWDLIYTYVLEK